MAAKRGTSAHADVDSPKNVIVTDFKDALDNNMILINSVSKALFGEKKYCPVCEKHGKFEEFGEGKRPNAKCAVCSSLERDRSYWLYLSSIFALERTKLSVLHFVPEACTRKRFLQFKEINYEVTDSDSLSGLPYENNSFDIVICNYVLQRIPDEKKALSEILRVLKTGGTAVLSVPMNNNFETTIENKAGSSSLRTYGNDYEKRLSDSGFTAKVVPIMDMFSDLVMNAHGLNKNERIAICWKK